MTYDEYVGELYVVKRIINIFHFDGPFWENLHNDDLIIPFEARMDGPKIMIVCVLTKYGIAQMYLYIAHGYVEKA